MDLNKFYILENKTVIYNVWLKITQFKFRFA